MMAMLLLTAVVGCIQKVPPDVVEAIDALDRQLIESQGAEYAPDAYARFIKHWVALRGRLQAEEDEIVWPWEENPILTALQQVRAEGEEAIAQSQERREARRLEAESRLVLLEGRLRVFNSRVDDIGSRGFFRMSCWVVPSLAAELWHIPLEQVWRRIRAGELSAHHVHWRRDAA